MRKVRTAAAIAALLVSSSAALAETCASSPAPATDKGAPATVGKDGVGGTGWTGGTGGLMAGAENEKAGRSPGSHNPDVAKGLDPTTGVTGEKVGPDRGPKPNC